MGPLSKDSLGARLWCRDSRTTQSPRGLATVSIRSRSSVERSRSYSSAVVPATRPMLHSLYVRLRRFAVAAILAIALGAPIVEMFDQWDHTLQDGNDTEANVVVAALCIGVAFAIGTVAVVARIRALASNSRVRTVSPRLVVFALAVVASPTPAASPPTPLRV